jgi:hypothetical protein
MLGTYVTAPDPGLDIEVFVDNEEEEEEEEEPELGEFALYDMTSY